MKNYFKLLGSQAQLIESHAAFWLTKSRTQDFLCSLYTKLLVFSVNLPLLWCAIVFYPHFITLWFYPQLFTSNCNFASGLCIFAPILTANLGQNCIDLWVVKGKITNWKDEGKITITLQNRGKNICNDPMQVCLLQIYIWACGLSIDLASHVLISALKSK
jgi:hypothetical protein